MADDQAQWALHNASDPDQAMQYIAAAQVTALAAIAAAVDRLAAAVEDQRS
jgi:hypothetical protein